jgi:spore coat protein U-like protein
MARARYLLQAITFVALLAPAVAPAQTCSFTAGPTSLAFGAYDPASATPADSTGTFSYSCTSARVRPVVVELSAGTAGSFSSRQMSFGAERLSYNLFTTGARSVVWGDGTGGSQTVSSVPSGPTHGATLTIYGRITAGQWVAAGTYGDTIVVTLNY